MEIDQIVSDMKKEGPLKGGGSLPSNRTMLLGPVHICVFTSVCVTANYSSTIISIPRFSLPANEAT